jgi:hypothetical protein
MADDAYARLTAGETTIEELRRVLPHQVIVEHRTRYGGTPAASFIPVTDATPDKISA